MIKIVGAFTPRTRLRQPTTFNSIDFDWKFSEFNGTGGYEEVWNAEADETSFYLRARLSCSPFQYSDSRFNGSKYSVVIEIGGFERFARRANSK